MAVLEHKTRKQVAVTIVRSVLKSGTVISRVDQVDVLFEFVSLLIKDEAGASSEARAPPDPSHSLTTSHAD